MKKTHLSVNLWIFTFVNHKELGIGYNYNNFLSKLYYEFA